MSAGESRLIVVTSRFPFGSQEAYLSVELAELARHFEHLVVVPVRTPTTPARHAIPSNAQILAWPLANPELLRRALVCLSTQPVRVARALGTVIASRDPAKLKNCAVLIKGLALGQWIMEHGAEHIHAYWMSTPSTVAMIASLTSGVPWSATAHRWDIYERNAFDAKERNVSYVRAISARGAGDLKARMPNLKGRIAHLRLGIIVPPLAAHVGDTAGFHIVCPAALVEVKGHVILLQALARLRRLGVPAHCTLYGTGPLRGELKNVTAALDLDDAVTFAGFVPQSTLHEEYRAGRFDAFVLASRASGEKLMEGVPSALLEAMAFGIPVVATDSGSVREALDAESGLLVAAEDPEALATALLDVYQDREGARARARRAHESVSANNDVRTQILDLATAIRGKERNR